MSDESTYTYRPDKLSIVLLPEQSDWECELFGMGPQGVVFRPNKGCEPNWFWRLMQQLILGNKWVKRGDEMSEWRELKTLQDVAAAQANGEEIQLLNVVSDNWEVWMQYAWHSTAKYRARPKAETVTLRKALFDDADQWGVCAYECTEEHARLRPNFVCWLGEPVTYEVKK